MLLEVVFSYLVFYKVCDCAELKVPHMASGNLSSSIRETEMGMAVGVKRNKSLISLLEQYLAELCPG